MKDIGLNFDSHQSLQNIIKCQEYDKIKKIDELNQYYQDFFDEDSLSKMNIYPSFNELLRNHFPIEFSVHNDGRFNSSSDYLTKMYELLRQSFMDPIQHMISSICALKPGSIQEFIQLLKQRQQNTQRQVFEIYDIKVQKREVTQAGFIITIEIEQNKNINQIQDLNEFQQFKTKNLVMLVNQKTGSFIFGTVYSQLTSDFDQDDENNSNQNSENNNNQQISDRPYQHSKVFSLQRIKILTNSNNYLDIIQQFDSKCEFTLLETTNYWLPVYYNLKVLYYMIKNQTQISFQDEILKGQQSSQSNQPQYELLKRKNKSYQNKLKIILKKVESRNDLDQSQKIALQSILTKNLHYVEGPPGTGKSFISVQGTINLLKLYSKLQEDSTEKKPIFILCKKNVSLDQFLTSLIQSNEQSVLRMGTPSDKFIKNFSLATKLKSLNLECKQNEILQEFKIMNNKLFLEEESEILTESQIIDFFNQSGIDLPEIYLNILKLKPRFISLFIQDFAPQLELSNYKREQFKLLLFETWIKNQMNYHQIYDFIMESRQKITKNLEKNLPIYIERISKQNIEIEKGKKLMDVDFQDNDYHEQTQFQIRNEKLPQKKKGQQFLRKLSSLQSFTQLTSEIRQQLIEYAKWYQKIDLIQQIQSFYRNEVKQINDQDILSLDRKKIELIRSYKVVGMTTTGFTKLYKYIQVIQPEIIIVEEASEVEEWNMACLLQPYVKHLIQIGDFKQLAPIYSNIKFINQHNIKKSQFQRVIQDLKLNISTKLVFQRRMIPELSKYPRIVYQEEYFKDHQKDVEQLIQQSNKRLEKKIMFINHTFPEQQSNRSLINQFEAQLAVFLAYMLNKFYSIPKSHITILCMYKSQVNQVKDFMYKFNSQKDVFTYDGYDGNQFVQTVDEYQGKENNYIILSCVRSNSNSYPGFLVEQNRINVAFSRAKQGLFVIGAFWMLDQKQLWKEFVSQAKSNGSYIQNLSDLPQFITEFYDSCKDNLKHKCQINKQHLAHIGSCQKEQDIDQDCKNIQDEIPNQQLKNQINNQYLEQQEQQKEEEEEEEEESKQPLKESSSYQDNNYQNYNYQNNLGNQEQEQRLIETEKNLLKDLTNIKKESKDWQNQNNNYIQKQEQKEENKFISIENKIEKRKYMLNSLLGKIEEKEEDEKDQINEEIKNNSLSSEKFQTPLEDNQTQVFQQNSNKEIYNYQSQRSAQQNQNGMSSINLHKNQKQQNLNDSQNKQISYTAKPSTRNKRPQYCRKSDLVNIQIEKQPKNTVEYVRRYEQQETNLNKQETTKKEEAQNAQIQISSTQQINSNFQQEIEQISLSKNPNQNVKIQNNSSNQQTQTKQNEQKQFNKSNQSSFSQKVKLKTTYSLTSQDNKFDTQSEESMSSVNDSRLSYTSEQQNITQSKINSLLDITQKSKLKKKAKQCK